MTTKSVAIGLSGCLHTLFAHARAVLQARATFILTSVLAIALPVIPAIAGDWLQWGGPNGDFTVESTKLADKWPEAGPPRLWKRELGDGYSSILSQGERVFTEYRKGDEYFVVSLDAKNGETAWEHRYSAKLWPDMEKGFGVGPNATPLIIGPRIISASIDGKLRCLNLDDGKLLWEKDLPAEFGRRKRVEEYGYSASPLAYKGTLIVQVGGDQHAVIALKPEDGSVAWKSEPGGVSYGQATITSLAGQDPYIYFEPEGVVGLDAASGKTLWKSPIEFNNGNHLTPVVKCDDNHLWVASQFLTGGARLIEVTKNGEAMSAKEKWFERRLRAAHWTNIRIGDYIYGSIGDNNGSFFSAFEWRTGKLAWRERGYHKAQTLYADGKMVFLDEEGKLTVAEVSPGGLKVLASAAVAEPISWTLPTLDGATLYARDRKNIMALNLGGGQ